MTGGDFRINILAAYDAYDELREAHRRAQQDDCDIRAAFDIDDVDLVIRTTPEPLLSGFLPLQCQYAQLRFLDTPLNELTGQHIDDMLADYRASRSCAASNTAMESPPQSTDHRRRARRPDRRAGTDQTRRAPPHLRVVGGRRRPGPHPYRRRLAHRPRRASLLHPQRRSGRSVAITAARRPVDRRAAQLGDAGARPLRPVSAAGPRTCCPSWGSARASGGSAVSPGRGSGAEAGLHAPIDELPGVGQVGVRPLLVRALLRRLRPQDLAGRTPQPRQRLGEPAHQTHRLADGQERGPRHPGCLPVPAARTRPALGSRASETGGSRRDLPR